MTSSSALEETAAALRECDLGQGRARPAEGARDGWKHGRLQGGARRRLRYRRGSPRRAGGSLGQLGLYATAADQLDLAVRNVRVLARAVATTVREGEAVPRGARRVHPRPRACRRDALSPTSRSPSIPWRPAGSPWKPREGRPPFSRSATISGQACWWARSGRRPWTSCAPLAWSRPEALEALRESANRTAREPTDPTV